MYKRQGQSPVSSREIENLNIKVTEGESFTPFRQSFAKSFVLFPKESIGIEVQLATPEPEGRFQLKASIRGIDQRNRVVRIFEQPEIRTWRRLPPVGTWVEEP